MEKYKEAYVRGRDAFYDGVAIKNNPYSALANYELYSAWCRGWVEAEVESYTYA